MARCSNKQVAKMLASGGVAQGRTKEEDVELRLPRWLKVFLPQKNIVN